MYLLGPRAWGIRVLASLLAFLLAGAFGGRGVSAQDEAPQQLTVFLDLVVEDATGQPVRNLTPEEVIITQEGVPQRVARLEAMEALGHYELSYVPASGKAGAVLVQFLRPGAQGHDPNGPGLKPRVVMPLSPLAATLTQALETRPHANDFPSHASAMHFDAAPSGTHYTLALEVPLGGLISPGSTRPDDLRLQIFARLRNEATGQVLQRFELDRSVPTSAVEGAQRLVWTGQVHVRSGSYVLETLAYDPVTARASVRKVPFEAIDPAPGLGLASVTLLRPVGGYILRDQDREADDPYFLGQDSLMPTLDVRTWAAPGARVEFFTIAYPDRASVDPVTLRLEILQGGKVLGTTPLRVPGPDARGEIRYTGGIPTRHLSPAEYVLRVCAQQGSMRRFEEAPFTVLGRRRRDAAPRGQYTIAGLRGDATKGR